MDYWAHLPASNWGSTDPVATGYRKTLAEASHNRLPPRIYPREAPASAQATFGGRTNRLCKLEIHQMKLSTRLIPPPTDRPTACQYIWRTHCTVHYRLYLPVVHVLDIDGIYIHHEYAKLHDDWLTLLRRWPDFYESTRSEGAVRRIVRWSLCVSLFVAGYAV